MRRRLLAVVAVALFALGACGGGDDGEDAADELANLGPNAVGMKDIKFVPATLKVKAGETVTWHFTDGNVQHNVKGDGFESKTMAKGEFEHTFDQPGKYDYVCTLHPTMKGTIDVGPPAP